MKPLNWIVKVSKYFKSIYFKSEIADSLSSTVQQQLMNNTFGSWLKSSTYCNELVQVCSEFHKNLLDGLLGIPC